MESGVISTERKYLTKSQRRPERHAAVISLQIILHRPPPDGGGFVDGENYCWLILLMTATASLTFRSVEPSGVSSAMSAQRNLYIATSLKDA